MTPATAWAEVVETCRQYDMAVTYDFDVEECEVDRRWALAEWQLACARERAEERSKS